MRKFVTWRSFPVIVDMTHYTVRCLVGFQFPFGSPLIVFQFIRPKKMFVFWCLSKRRVGRSVGKFCLFVCVHTLQSIMYTSMKGVTEHLKTKLHKGWQFRPCLCHQDTTEIFAHMCKKYMDCQNHRQEWTGKRVVVPFSRTWSIQDWLLAFVHACLADKQNSQYGLN